MNTLPLALYVAAATAYAVHFARRSDTAGRGATVALVAATLAHTFVIGMQTCRWVTSRSSERPVRSPVFVYLLALAYLYTE